MGKPLPDMLTWLADVTLGPRCPHGCGHRARGWRSLAAHVDLDHAGDREADRG